LGLQVGVDVFSFAPQYTDLASLAALCKYTGGQVYYFPSFGAQRDGPKLNFDLKRNLLRETGEHSQ
jgi:protein transport protein SEC24